MIFSCTLVILQNTELLKLRFLILHYNHSLRLSHNVTIINSLLQVNLILIMIFLILNIFFDTEVILTFYTLWVYSKYDVSDDSNIHNRKIAFNLKKN